SRGGDFAPRPELPRLLSFRQGKLPQPHIPPAPALPSNLLVPPRAPEAEAFMQANAPLVGEGDRSEGLGEALVPEHGDQRTVERRADPAAVLARADVHRGLDRV